MLKNALYALYRLRVGSMDFNLTCIVIFLGHEKEMVRF